MALSSSRLTYRQPEPADLARLFEIYGDPRTQQFNPAGPLVSINDARRVLDTWLAHWQAHGFGWWAIAQRELPETVVGFGGIAYYNYGDEPRLNLGYRFAVEAWGKGFATELGATAISHAFESLGVERIWALVRPSHNASINVLEKLSMKRCGYLDDVPGQAPSVVYTIGT